MCACVAHTVGATCVKVLCVPWGSHCFLACLNPAHIQKAKRRVSRPRHIVWLVKLVNTASATCPKVRSLTVHLRSSISSQAWGFQTRSSGTFSTNPQQTGNGLRRPRTAGVALVTRAPGRDAATRRSETGEDTLARRRKPAAGVYVFDPAQTGGALCPLL